MTEETYTYIHPCKCMACSLHWNVYSWNKWWPHLSEDGDDRMAFCPECASQSILLYNPIQTDDFIFNHVPGMAQGIKSFNLPQEVE